MHKIKKRNSSSSSVKYFLNTVCTLNVKSQVFIFFPFSLSNKKSYFLPRLIDTCKTFGSLDGPDKSVSQLLVALVRGQIQPVETRVSPGERVGVPPPLDREKLRSVAAVKLLEPVHGDAGGAGHKLQKSEKN